MAAPVDVQRTLDPSEQSVGQARRFVRDALTDWSLDDVADTAVLAVSELVTNVVLHAGTSVQVRMQRLDSRIRLEVQDSRAERLLPMSGVGVADDAEGGRGLLIASSLARAWGVTYAGGTKTVWLDLPVDGQDDPVPGEDDHVGDPDPLPGLANGSTPRVAPRPPAGTRVRHGAGSDDVLTGVSSDALDRLGVDDYLTLAVERTRDSVQADAAFLLLASDFALDFEVKAVSGLDATLISTRVDARGPGMPDPRHPHLPVLVPDLGRFPVPLLQGTALASLAVAPVNVEGRVAGVLAVASEHRDGFNDHESALLQRTADAIAVAVDRARLRAAERERRGWLSFISEAGDLLAGSLDARMTMAITGQIVVPQLGRWCAVYLEDERHHDVLEHVWHQDESLLGRLREALEAEETPGGVDDLVSVEVVRLPLVARGRRIGVMLLGRDRGDLLVGELLLIAESVARRSALALDNARAHGDLQDVGNVLQASLLPARLPDAPGMEVGVVYEAAGEALDVGGDFYDFFAVERGRYCFVVGDVCGKGAQAAAVTGLARHTVRALALAGFPLGEVLDRLNAAILDESSGARYLTLVCGFVRPVQGGVLTTLACAGHPPPFVVSAEGRVRRIGRPQTVLGIFEDVRYEPEELTLDRGDMLVAMTDGVLERRDGGRMLGDEGVVAELIALAGHPPQAVAEGLRRRVLDFAPTPQQDDLAALAIRFS